MMISVEDLIENQSDPCVMMPVMAIISMGPVIIMMILSIAVSGHMLLTMPPVMTTFCPIMRAVMFGRKAIRAVMAAFGATFSAVMAAFGAAVMLGRQTIIPSMVTLLDLSAIIFTKMFAVLFAKMFTVLLTAPLMSPVMILLVRLFLPVAIGIGHSGRAAKSQGPQYKSAKQRPGYHQATCCLFHRLFLSG